MLMKQAVIVLQVALILTIEACMKEKIQLFHVEHFKVSRDTFALSLIENAKFQLAGQQENCDDLLEKIRQVEVDVIILNLDGDDPTEKSALGCVDICKDIQKHFPEMKIIVHTVYDTADNIAKCMNAGADGFIHKTTGYEELLQVIEQVANGDKYLHPSIWHHYNQPKAFLQHRIPVLLSHESSFTKREIEVLRLLAESNSTKIISGILSISLKTVETHRKNLLKKSGMQNTAGLISYAHKNKYL